MASVKFNDNSAQVIGAINNAVGAFLEEASAELESQTKRNTRTDTYQTKNSWRHKVNISKAEALVGSPLENAVWEEFGTGEYALKGNGRKGGWMYQDRNGKWHFTRGKTPSRALENAKTTCEPVIIEVAKAKFGVLDE